MTGRRQIFTFTTCRLSSIGKGSSLKPLSAHSTARRNGGQDWIFQQTCWRAKLAPPISSSSVTQQENQDPFRALDPGSFILKAGRPVLVVPKGVASFSPKHVAIAWKDAREARRAVLDALPFLQQAETVMIVEILDSGSELTSRAIKDVSNYLTRHGIKTIAERLRPADVTPANSLLRLIEDENINLMVAGAYGHSRLGEWAFGGVTRDLLQESPICCLFAH